MSITQLSEVQEAGRRLSVVCSSLGQARLIVESLIDYAVPKTVRPDFPMEVEDIRRLRALERILDELGEWACERSKQLR